MRGKKPLAIVLILSMLSACAGTHAERLAEKEAARNRADSAEGTYQETLRAKAAHHHRRRAPAPPYPDHPPYPEEPSPEARYAAEVMFLVTAQIFVCSFVVVVLDGHCDLGLSVGYPYY